MTPFLNDPDVTIYLGNVATLLHYGEIGTESTTTHDVGASGLRDPR